MKLTDLKDPIPADIEIAQSANLLPISQIAQEIGLQNEEVDSYGIHKAKAGPRSESLYCSARPNPQLDFMMGLSSS